MFNILALSFLRMSLNHKHTDYIARNKTRMFGTHLLAEIRRRYVGNLKTWEKRIQYISEPTQQHTSKDKIIKKSANTDSQK